MWKEMRMFATPFYQEHIMELREHLKKREPVLRTRTKAEEVKLKRQRLAWEKQDAEEDAEDEEDPEKRAEDKMKVVKLEKAEKRAQKEEEALDERQKRQERQDDYMHSVLD